MSVSTVVTAFSPPHFHQLHASIEFPSHNAFCSYNASGKAACLKNEVSVDVRNMILREPGYGSKHRRKLVEKHLMCVSAEHKTVNDIIPHDFLLENEEQRSMSRFMNDESLELASSTSYTSSVDVAVADTGISATQLQHNPAYFIDSAKFSYLKSITSGHWKFINKFLDEEPDEQRRLELREACISLMSTINNVRLILHDRYYVGEKLEVDDMEIVCKLLLHHPKAEEKLGCGLQYIKVGRHPKYDCRCFFIVRKDGSCIDFSFRKCILELGDGLLGPGITKRLLDFRLLAG